MAITMGDPGAPSQITINFDSLFTQTLANYRKKMTDNIGAINSILYQILNSDAYESADGGTDIREPLMYGLAQTDTYDGYDELSMLPTEGITEAVYLWRNMATPVIYAMTDVRKNRATGRLLDMVKTKIKQAELGIQESWARQFMWGNVPNGGLLTDPYQSGVNGSLGVEPLCKMIAYNSSTLTVGNIPESTETWWRNQSFTSTASTYSTFMLELNKLYNRCSLGTGGPPDIFLADELSYELFHHAYFSVYKASPDAVGQEFPFVAKKYLKAKIVMDDKVPDVYSGVIPTVTGGIGDSTSLTYGTIFAANTQFMKIRYQPGMDFEMLTDDSGKSFAKPINGDSRAGHMGWTGQVTCNNRRKQGVLAKIARSLS